MAETDDAAEDALGAWLLRQGLADADADEIVRGYCNRLLEEGVALHRAVMGGLILHPNFGALDVVWNASDRRAAVALTPRRALATEEFQNTPFYRLAVDPVPFKRFRLDGERPAEWYPVFDRLRAQGVTDYLLFCEPYGSGARTLWSELPDAIEGVVLSLSTRRADGFTEEETARLRRLMPAFALAIKSATHRRFTRALVETYLGPFSGGRVLAGEIERGAGREIDCVLFYTDLRGSTALAEEMALDDYLALLNDYFDCTAEAVVEHGGEVLKFIGDAVMAIFPVGADRKGAGELRRAALAAAREALARRDRLRDAWGARLDFGVALHAGKVQYGNVGTEDRLDFTVIGPPVNRVARLEGLSKALGVAVVASAEFVGDDPEGMVPLGAHRIAGVAEPVEVYGLE